MNNLKNKQYSNIKLNLTIIGFVANLIFLLVLYFFNFTFYLNSLLINIDSIFISRLIFIILFLCVIKLFSMPFDIYSGYILEHKFNLSKQTIFQYLKEDFKSSILVLIFSCIFIEAIYFLFDFSPKYWWFFLWLLWNMFTFLITIIFPNFILPVFYKLEKIDNIELVSSINNLCKKLNFQGLNSEIYSFNLGKDTIKANAAVVGFWFSRKIILSDTLIEKFSLDEISSILAHEIGHVKKRHMLKNIVFTIFASFFVLLASNILLSLIFKLFNIGALSDISNLPMFLVYFFTVFVVFSPISNFISRKMEVEADFFALRNYDAQHFISAMNKLKDLNLADESPNKIIEFLFYSHPSIKNRINFAKGFLKYD